METKQNAKRRQVLSDNMINNVTNRFVVMTDDVQRVGKKVSYMYSSRQDDTEYGIQQVKMYCK